MKRLATYRRPLDAAAREHLARLLAERPDATPGRLAILFRARTGIDYSAASMKRVRRTGVRPHPKPPLTGAESAELDRLVRAMAGDSYAWEVAEEFRLSSGRSVSPAIVNRRARAMGFPGRKKGTRKGDGCPVALAEARIAEASAVKLARSKVDRSPRVGRAGRVAVAAADG